jgi:hypothetical protein
VAPPNWPVLTAEGGWPAGAPVQPAGTFLLDDPASGLLDTSVLGGAPVTTWTDLTAWVRSGTITRPATRQQGPLYAYQQATATLTLNNADGRWDPDNLAGPYVTGGATSLTAMVPVRVRATYNGVTWPLFWGYSDSWDDDGTNRGPRYAETVLSASDAQKILNAVRLPATAAAGAGETTGARIGRILDAAKWYTGTGQRQVTGGDSAWTLMQTCADSEIGELYLNGAGQLVFRNRRAILTEARSNTPQAVLGDQPGTAEPAGTELPYAGLPRSRDDATLANDIQATRISGGVLQQVQDTASIARFLFPRSYARSDLILQDDATVLNWAQWVLAVSRTDEDRMDTVVINPLRDPANLWPQVLGREIGDRIQVWRRPPGVAAAITKDQFIRSITHAFDVSAGTWTTTWGLQDASRYGSFLTLDQPALGQLDVNSLAF